MKEINSVVTKLFDVLGAKAIKGLNPSVVSFVFGFMSNNLENLPTEVSMDVLDFL